MPNVRLYGDHAEPNKLKSDRTGAGTIAFKLNYRGATAYDRGLPMGQAINLLMEIITDVAIS